MPTLQYILFIFEALIALGLIIFVHELGHFMTAKWFGVRVRRFAMGMGPPLLRWVRGETEYSIRAIPIGGFVDLVGEHPEAEEADDPRGLWRRPAWQKLIVFAAGVTMNAVLAIILFTVAPMIGVEVASPYIGEVVPGMPAEQAGLKAGDRIVSIDDSPVYSFEDVLNDVGLSNAGTTFKVGVERRVPGAEAPEKLVLSVKSVRGNDAPMPQIGVMWQMDAKIAKIHMPSSPVRQAGLKEGDRILEVNGQPVDLWQDMEKLLAAAPPGQTELRVQRGDETLNLKVDFAALRVYDYGIKPPTQIGGVEPGSPADKASLCVGDRIAAVQDKPWPSFKDTPELVKAAAGNPVRLLLVRDGKAIEKTVTPAVLPGADYPRLGIRLDAAIDEPLQIGDVDAKGPAAAAGVQPGDLVVAATADGRDVQDWEGLTLMKSEGKPVSLKLARGAETLTVTVTPKLDPQDHLSMVDALGDIKYVPLPRIMDPITAARRGFHQTGVWFGRAYITLKQLVTGQVSTKMASGPVGIARYSFLVASHGLGSLIDFVGMLCVFIAVLNFLPLPPFDGGHALFVLIEAIRRKPVGMKARNVVWIVGWCLVGLLFLVVTYRDIYGWLASFS